LHSDVRASVKKTMELIFKILILKFLVNFLKFYIWA